MIKVKNLTKHYGKKLVVDSLSFEMPGPGVYALLGTNGAGKTTFIRALLSQVGYRGVIELYYDTRKEPCDHYERLHLFTATEWEGEITMDGPDGQLAWVEKERVAELNLWHGCRVALRALEQDLRFFHLMLCYKPGGILCDAALNQKRVPLEAWIT